MTEHDMRYYAPLAPEWRGYQGEVVKGCVGSDTEGEWRWDDFWGWSNYIAKNPEVFKNPERGPSRFRVGIVVVPEGDDDVG